MKLEGLHFQTVVYALLFSTLAPAKLLKALPRPTCDKLILLAHDPVMRRDWMNDLKGRDHEFWDYIDSVLEYSLQDPSQSIPSYFGGNIPSSHVLQLMGLNYRLGQLNLGAFDSSALRSQLKGRWSEKVLIVVHQDKALQRKTANWMKKDKFKNAPRLILFSEEFPVRSRVLREQASLLEYSMNGEHGSVVNTSEIHVVGGNLGSCLNRAILNAATNALGFHPSISIHLYMGLIYGDSKELARLHSGKSLSHGQWQFLAELAVLGHFQMDRENWSRPALVESALPTFRFQRRDGRLLNIIFHDVD